MVLGMGISIEKQGFSNYSKVQELCRSNSEKYNFLACQVLTYHGSANQGDGSGVKIPANAPSLLKISKIKDQFNSASGTEPAIQKLMSVFNDVRLGLNFLHSEGFAHLQVCPTNIIVSKGLGILKGFKALSYFIGKDIHQKVFIGNADAYRSIFSREDPTFDQAIGEDRYSFSVSLLQVFHEFTKNSDLKEFSPDDEREYKDKNKYEYRVNMIVKFAATIAGSMLSEASEEVVHPVFINAEDFFHHKSKIKDMTETQIVDEYVDKQWTQLGELLVLMGN